MLRDQAKSWLYELTAYDIGEKQRLQRAASAKGYGLNPVEFSRPYPSTASSTTTNVTAVAENSNASASIQEKPSSTIPPKKSNLPAWIAAGVLGTAGVLGGGVVVNNVYNKPGTNTNTVIPFVWDEIEQIQVEENGKLVWKSTGKSIRKRLNADKTEDVFDPNSGTWKRSN